MNLAPFTRGLSPYAPALLSLSLFVILVAVLAFNVVFLSLRERNKA
jgi:hypothetical protein